MHSEYSPIEIGLAALEFQGGLSGSKVLRKADSSLARVVRKMSGRVTTALARHPENEIEITVAAVAVMLQAARSIEDVQNFILPALDPACAQFEP